VFAELKTKLDRHAKAFAKDLSFDLGAGRLKLDSLWVNILKPGTVFMWESWLRHEVPANQARTDRISISFNYGWR
jgi:hypothetical protein